MTTSEDTNKLNEFINRIFASYINQQKMVVVFMKFDPNGKIYHDNFLMLAPSDFSLLEKALEEELLVIRNLPRPPQPPPSKTMEIKKNDADGTITIYFK